MAQAEARLRPPFSSLVRDLEFPAQRSGLSETARAAVLARTVFLEPGSQGHSGNREESRAILALLFAVTAFVLLIACANVANLLMARATERAAEVSVRLAVGASGWAVFRLLFVESALLALLGGAASIAVARVTMVLLLGLMPVDDAEVLAFSLERADPALHRWGEPRHGPPLRDCAGDARRSCARQQPGGCRDARPRRGRRPGCGRRWRAARSHSPRRCSRCRACSS